MLQISTERAQEFGHPVHTIVLGVRNLGQEKADA